MDDGAGAAHWALHSCYQNDPQFHMLQIAICHFEACNKLKRNNRRLEMKCNKRMRFNHARNCCTVSRNATKNNINFDFWKRYAGSIFEFGKWSSRPCRLQMTFLHVDSSLTPSETINCEHQCSQSTHTATSFICRWTNLAMDHYRSLSLSLSPLLSVST